jgi:hypothetical protein
MAISKDKFNFKFKYNKSFVLLCADNGYGKTSMLQSFICAGAPKDRIYLLNTSRQHDWSGIIPDSHIYKPLMFNQDFIDQFILEFAMGKDHSNCLLILDDLDAFPVKKSDIIYKFVREARHSNIGIVITTGMLQKIPTIYYQMAEYSFFGPQSNKYNIQYINKTSITDGYILSEIERYTFAVWSREEKKMYLVKLDEKFVK